jgi:N-acyl-D-aspartate/D-glutamate deacylase
MSADLVIKGGTVVDGTGTAPRRAEVAITDGRVSDIGPKLAGDRIIDASGQIVAPGFIDIHTHYDAQVFWDPALSPSCYHGVTTVVAGNCGFSIAPTRTEHHDLIARTLENVEDMDVAALGAGIPWDFATFPEYLASVERRGTGLNFAAYIGHTALRLFVLGDDAYERASTPEEVVAIQHNLREAMLAGAAGFATSFAITHRGVDGKPVPSRFSDKAEFEAILDVMREVGRGVVSIAPGQQCGIADMYELQPKTGVPFTYGALLTSPTGQHRQQVELNHNGWNNGAQVWPQVTPRPLVFALTLAAPFTFNMNSNFAALMGKDIAERREAYASKDWRAKAMAEWDANPGFTVPRWETFDIAQSAAHPELEGRMVRDLARERGVTPFDVLLDLALEEPDLALRARCILANDDADEVAALLSEPHCAVGLSDAGAHVGQLCDAPQATDLLGNWVRGRKAIPLELAIRKLSGAQADLLGVPDRGYLKPGMCADVVVFDADTVAPGSVRRVRDFPADSERLTADDPTGVQHVLVNGTPIRADGVQVNAHLRPGRLVRPAARQPAR